MKYRTLHEILKSITYPDMYEQDEPVYCIAAWKELYIGYKYYEV